MKGQAQLAVSLQRKGESCIEHKSSKNAALFLSHKRVDRNAKRFQMDGR